MASNFKIMLHRDSESLHLKLRGDFDGSSAWELFNTIETNRHKTDKIFVHCNCLRKIYPFGRDVFHAHIHNLKPDTPSLIFTGENAGQIAPEESVCL